MENAYVHAMRRAFAALLTMALCLAMPAVADSKNLMSGFSRLDGGASLLLMAPDIELFSISGGGVTEPKADWTEAATGFVSQGISTRLGALKLETRRLDDDHAEEFIEVNALHGAVARSIALHHFGPGMFALPTKSGKLDWSLGDSVRGLREKTGSDYALFVWMRDSYASAERKAAMVAMALLGVGIAGGLQQGYASLVDLRTGQIMWFNRLLRASGDLREAQSAEETVKALLAGFPAAQ